jgi:hypothetical protein
MGTGKPRISTAAQLVGKVAGRRALERELGQAVEPETSERETAQVAVLELVIGLGVVPELGIGPVAAELELGTVLVAEPALEVGLAVEPELETVPVAALKLGIGPVAVPELETAPVVVLELELVQVAVPLRTKSVITPHHRGLVPLLGVEDLAAEVETTREPAATEAVKAWEAAE